MYKKLYLKKSAKYLLLPQVLDFIEILENRFEKLKCYNIIITIVLK